MYVIHLSIAARKVTPPIRCVGTDKPSSSICVIQALLKIVRIVEQL
jgi:hypothetical protein